MNIAAAARVFLGLLSFSSLFPILVCSQKKTTLFFAFGDSYVDTGNTLKSGSYESGSYKHPYGITWPGHPTGRFGDGKIQTDYFAELLGLPLLPPYVYSAGLNISSGVNFAVAGSGVTYGPYGNFSTSLGAQVDNFELLLRTKNPYSKVALANSLTLLGAESGNDYLVFTGNGSSLEYLRYIDLVVSGFKVNLQRLFDLGLRNVMVSNLAPVGCLPLVTQSNNYKHCVNYSDELVQHHNTALLAALWSLNARNFGARFIILNQEVAFGHLIWHAKALGFTDGITPCCKGTSNNFLNTSSVCGDVDPVSGKWLYTICKNRGKAIFWDVEHPTMRAWQYLIRLYVNHPGFLLLSDSKAPTLKKWLQINEATQEHVGVPEAPPNTSLAAGQLKAAFNFLLNNSYYSEAVGLLQTSDLESLLGQEPQTIVTVFLPSNEGFLYTDPTFINRVFSENKVANVAQYHTVRNYYDTNALVTGLPATLTTLSNQQLPTSYGPLQGIYIGVNATAKIVDPNLYNVPGQIVIHGINHVLMPPGL